MERHLLGGLAVPMKNIFTGEDLFRAFNSVHVDWKKVVWIWDIFATVMQIEKNGNNFNVYSSVCVKSWGQEVGQEGLNISCFIVQEAWIVWV